MPKTPAYAPDYTWMTEAVYPHSFVARGWRFWICDLCYAPRSLHPRLTFVRRRPEDSNSYLSKDAPHFTEQGW